MVQPNEKEMDESVSMSFEDEARIKLMEHYNSKNESHIRNIYSLVATFFGLIITDGLTKLSNYGLKISFWDLLAIIVLMGLYFFIRVRFWSRMISSILNVEPVPSKIVSNNVLGNLHRGCIKKLENREGSGKLSACIDKIILMSSKNWCKLVYWFIIIVCIIFLSKTEYLEGILSY